MPMSGWRSRQRPMRGNNQRLRKRRQQRDADALRLVARGGRRRAHAVVELRQRRLDRAQQRLAGRVEHETPAAAIEQREADLLLEQLDLLAERAVRQVQLIGCGAQVGQARDDAKDGQGLQRQAHERGRHLVRIATQSGQNKSLPLGGSGH